MNTKEACEYVSSLRYAGACLFCKGSIDARVIEDKGDYGVEYKCIGTEWKMCPNRHWGTHGGVVGMHYAYRLGSVVE